VASASSVVQRQAAVNVDEKEDHRVTIKAAGKAGDFSGGTSAKDRGWNNVASYYGKFKVGDDDWTTTQVLNNNFLDAHAGHVLASQNGGDGGDANNVFAQDGGVNTASYRRDLEIPMRKRLDQARSDEDVKFRVSLYGSGKTGQEIRTGDLEKKGSELYLGAPPSPLNRF